MCHTLAFLDHDSPSSSPRYTLSLERSFAHLRLPRSFSRSRVNAKRLRKMERSYTYIYIHWPMGDFAYQMDERCLWVRWVGGDRSLVTEERRGGRLLNEPSLGEMDGLTHAAASRFLLARFPSATYLSFAGDHALKIINRRAGRVEEER